MSQIANEALIAFVKALARRQARIDIALEAQRRSHPCSSQSELRLWSNCLLRADHFKSAETDCSS